MAYLSKIPSRWRFVSSFSFSQRRYRVKSKWASTRPKKTPCELALDHFDTYYKPVFTSQWPSLRIALLSQQKYCALLNNFAEDRDVVSFDLNELGAHDFVRRARENEIYDRDRNTGLSTNTVVGGSSNLDDIRDEIADYMPGRKILSKKQEMLLMEMEQNTYRADVKQDIEVTVPKTPLQIPFDLMAFTYDEGDISRFPPASQDASQKLSYYLMDGSSVLPVIALGLEPGCTVLDLCAAPGGKSLAILQTLLCDQLTCVDRSYSRLKRLKEIMRWYVPKYYIDDGRVSCELADGVEFCSKLSTQGRLYDRVLVDVPCYTDRHVLTKEENNLFQHSRLGERLNLQETQKNLLIAGVQCCRPGGVVVYSTCTLSPTQNDGVVRAALERIWQETNFEVVIESVDEIASKFSRTFTFHTTAQIGSRYGCLVLPKLTSNYGPMYFCRLRRIK